MQENTHYSVQNAGARAKKTLKSKATSVGAGLGSKAGTSVKTASLTPDSGQFPDGAAGPLQLNPIPRQVPILVGHHPEGPGVPR